MMCILALWALCIVFLPVIGLARPAQGQKARKRLVAGQ